MATFRFATAEDAMSVAVCSVCSAVFCDLCCTAEDVVVSVYDGYLLRSATFAVRVSPGFFKGRGFEQF